MKRLQLGLARRYGVRATDQEVTETITRIAGQAGMPLDQFLNRVETSIGLPLNEYRETIRRQLTLQQISQGVVASRIQVSDQDIDSFLKSADAKFWSSADYHVGHIFIPVSQSSTFEEAQQAEKDAQSIYTRLLQGANFEATAIAESKGPAALNGGDLGWRKTSTLPSIFADLVPKLDVGQVSKPMRSQAGYHILKLKDKRGDDKQVITQSNVSHILLKTNEIRDDQEAQRQLREFKQQVIAGDATFEDIAKEHTDDIGSKLSGGNMGWSSRGVFVPEFEKVMLEIAEGEISEPFKTQFGWHILTVSERREEDVTEDVLRNRARNVIRSRRFEDELQLWVQEMRDNAFIDIRI